MPEPLKLTGSLVLFKTHLRRWHRLSSGVSQMICQSKITWLLTDCPLVSITVLILHCVYVWMCESAWIDSVINDLHFNTPINHSVWSHVWNCKSHPLFFPGMSVCRRTWERFSLRASFHNHCLLPHNNHMWVILWNHFAC